MKRNKMKDNKTEQEILDWWIMNTHVEYRKQERHKKILLMIDKELLKSRELSKNRRPEVVSEKEITKFFWNVGFEFHFSNTINSSFRSYKKMQKGNLKSNRELWLSVGNSKEEFNIKYPKPNQICLDAIFHSLDMLESDFFHKREEEREKMK